MELDLLPDINVDTDYNYVGNVSIPVETPIEDQESLAREHERKILQEAKDRLKIAVEYDRENREDALTDLEFAYVEGAQWPEALRRERLNDGRPCIEINPLPTYIDQVVGDQRQNRPSVGVVPVDSKSDPVIARILRGWIKHVLQISQADTAIDHGFEHSVACGYGAMRVVTKYTDDSSFEQEAYVEKIDNALSVFWGKHTKYDCSDAKYCFVVTDMDREEYKQEYGHEPMSFTNADGQFLDGWVTKDTVRICEYFKKEPIERTIYLLQDGRTVDMLFPDEIPVKTRKVKSHKIKWYLLSGDKILDEKDWVGKKYIPIIPIWGKEINIAGKRCVRGLIKYAKSPKAMQNYWESSLTEQIALQPKAPYLATPEQLKGHESQWNEAHKKNFPYLYVNPDQKSPGWPRREAPPQMSPAMVERSRTTEQQIRDTIGLQKASMGMQGNERSGVAIRERKQEGDVGTFPHIDNLARSIEYLGRVLVDIAPGILDTERIIRLGLEDGSFEFEGVNIETLDGLINDLSMGTYDVVVTTGPSFTTQRTEARQSMAEAIQYAPQIFPLIGDLYAKSMDWSGAEEMAERLEYLLPPEIREKKMAERAKKQGIPPSPTEQQPPPDPMAIVQVQEAEMKLKELQIKIEQEKVKLTGMQLDNEMKVSQSDEKVRQILDEIKKGVQ